MRLSDTYADFRAPSWTFISTTIWPVRNQGTAARTSRNSAASTAGGTRSGCMAGLRERGQVGVDVVEQFHARLVPGISSERADGQRGDQELPGETIEGVVLRDDHDGFLHANE